jgi:quinolinate synthase
MPVRPTEFRLDRLPNEPRIKAAPDRKKYSLEQQIERAKTASEAVKAGHFYTLDELIDDE